MRGHGCSTWFSQSLGASLSSAVSSNFDRRSSIVTTATTIKLHHHHCHSSSALAIVCDEYLCPAIEEICERLQIPDDVAGATLLALGSSAPEIIVNVAATIRWSSVGN